MNYFKHDKALVDDGAVIGEGTRVWANTHIQNGAVVGKGCNICDGSFVEKGAVVGDHVTIKHNVSIFDGVTIEDNVFVGSNIAFINDRFPRSYPGQKWTLEKTRVKSGASLGANAVILGGLTIGTGAFVGAGSVVTRDVPDYTLVAGNPARALGFICRCGQRLKEAQLICSCGTMYQKEEGALKLAPSFPS